MKSEKASATKELYAQLRALPWESLWNEEVPRFNRGNPQERATRVALVRAVGVVFSESGRMSDKEAVKNWLAELLHDPNEKIRRYAIAALPKIGATAEEEAELLSLLAKTTSEREKKFLGQALEKIGGEATLQIIQQGKVAFTGAEQKVKASVARQQAASAVRLDSELADFRGLRIHLRGRRGLERIVREEMEANAKTRGKFRVGDMRAGFLALVPTAPFSLGDLYSLRCCGTVGLLLGAVPTGNDKAALDEIAEAITSPQALRVWKTFTKGPIRYRLEFMAKGHQRGAVQHVIGRAYELCAQILNDSRSAPWEVDVFPAGRENFVELRPRFSPDPRFYYRQDDVPAASHPPLAACLARVARVREQPVIWDPFCGSGSELIERALLGGVRQVFGTDRSAEAVAIAEGNFSAANLPSVEASFTCCDFREFRSIPGLRAGAVDLIISNPPMGRRVPIADLKSLIDDLFEAAAIALKPGGTLVFANPISTDCPELSLERQSRQVVDLGGFDCYLEMYTKRR